MMVISIPLKHSPKTEIRKYLQKKYGKDAGIKCISYMLEPFGNFAQSAIFFFLDRYNIEKKVSAIITRSTVLFEEFKEMETMH